MKNMNMIAKKSYIAPEAKVVSVEPVVLLAGSEKIEITYEEKITKPEEILSKKNKSTRIWDEME